MTFYEEEMFNPDIDKSNLVGGFRKRYVLLKIIVNTITFKDWYECTDNSTNTKMLSMKNVYIKVLFLMFEVIIK